MFMPDNELDASEKTTTFEEFATFCRDADVLGHDAQFLDEELSSKQGWGHRCVSQACELAIAAGVSSTFSFSTTIPSAPTTLSRRTPDRSSTSTASPVRLPTKD